MGGGGEAPSIGGAIGDVTGSFPQIAGAYRKFAKGEPLLREAKTLGLGAIRGISPYLIDILSHPYDVPPELLNMATQGARAAFQARGNVYGNQALAGELLNRENVRQQRISTALGQAGQAEQLAINPELAQVGAFSSLINPAYGLAGQTLGAQAASSAQNKSGTQSAIGTGASIIGSVAAAY
jgi:hypothetical protein